MSIEILTYSDILLTVNNIKYGILYNYYAATNENNIAAYGWRLPTYADFVTLSTYLGGNSVSGGKLKETGTTYWNTPNTDATNEVGFSGIGSGVRNSTDGSFVGIKNLCYLWSAPFSIYVYSYAQLVYTGANIQYGYSTDTSFFKYGFSIRLIKDNTSLTHGQTGRYKGNDGTFYNTICIGTQEWLSDNLAETKYRNGDNIPEVTDTTEWIGLTTGAMCVYDNDWTNSGISEPALELTFDSITNVPVANVTSISDWNTFFDLPTNGTPFVSVVIDENVVKLGGNGSINLFKTGLFSYNLHLLKLKDYNGIIKEIGSYTFEGSGITEMYLYGCTKIHESAFTDLWVDNYITTFIAPNLIELGGFNFQFAFWLEDISLPKLIIMGEANFYACNILKTVYIPKCTTLGNSINLSDNIFPSASANLPFTLTIPASLMTCNGGNPEGDIQWIIDNYTNLTIITV